MEAAVSFYLRLARMIALAALILSVLLGGIGWLLGWRTSTQFSNGFFIGGGVLIVLGVFSVMGGFSQRADFKMTYSRTASPANIGERARQMIADVNQGYNALIFLTLTGVLLIGIAVLISNLIG
ncbi:MAG: hypothetical protein AB1564_01120 [Chloroflexota bacterium]